MDTLKPIDPKHTELARSLADKGTKYALATWIDVLGRAKSKSVPISHLPNLLAGSERYTPRGMGGIGSMNPVEEEVIALPDESTLLSLPWDHRFVWMAADMSYGGLEPFALCPRSTLKRQIAAAAEAGFICNLGVEPEFYAFRPESLEREVGRLIPVAHSEEIKPSPAYDVEATLDSANFLDRMVECMHEAGFKVYSFDAEGGEGQYELDFDYAPILEMSDKMTLFRLMARQVAKETGLLVTFMPKPYADLWGSGAHFNMSLSSIDTEENVFRNNSEPQGWTKEAYAFTAGVLRHAPALAAISNPLVNSYKRLVPRLADGSISWAPIMVSYGHNNRSCMMRLPDNRPAVENRSIDTAANTYLAGAFMLAAGLEGIREDLDPGAPTDDLTYERTDIPRLPRTLLEAVEAFESDPLTYEVFAKGFIRDYVEMKRGEWEKSHLQVTDWERDAYLLNV